VKNALQRLIAITKAKPTIENSVITAFAKAEERNQRFLAGVKLVIRKNLCVTGVDSEQGTANKP
jgi:hypothetical protein